MIKPIRYLCAILAAMTAATAIAAPTHAKSDDDYRLVYDGVEYEGKTFTLNGRAYVSLREFACTIDNSVVTWNGDTFTATVTTDALYLTAKDGAFYINANGRMLWCENGVFTRDGVLYVPLWQAAKAFGFISSYDASTHTTTITRVRGGIKSDDEYYNSNDLYWLAKIIHAEARGEPFLGKLAVGSVILNRVDSSQFPNTIYDVIFDRKNGVQFSPTVDGAIQQSAGEESVIAAKICLENTRISDKILYFLNKSAATNFWVVDNCRYILTVGNHDFYAP